MAASYSSEEKDIKTPVNEKDFFLIPNIHILQLCTHPIVVFYAGISALNNYLLHIVNN